MVTRERGVERHPMHEHFVEITDHAAEGIPAKAERVTTDKPKDGCDAHRDEALNHNPENIAFSREASVKEGEPRRHEHDETGGEKHEAGNSCIKHKRSFVAEVYK